MSGINELDNYIRLKDLELEHPYTVKIPLTRGRLVSSDEYVFGIKWNEYKELAQVRGEYHFEFRENEYQCSIIDLTKKRVKLRIEDLQEKLVENGTIKVDMSNIIKREKRGLCLLKEEENLSERLLLFGNSDITGGLLTECKFENENLNSEQKQAIKYAVGVRDLYLIWGPPGTGKTTIVPEIVSNYIKLHPEDTQKILVCSYMNKAVDNVVKKLFDNGFSIVRFGDSSLTGTYKDVLFDVLFKKKQKEIEKSFKEKIERLQQKKKEIEEKLKSNSKEAEKVENNKEIINSDISALNSDISRIREQITNKEHSLVKARLEKKIATIDKELLDCREDLRKPQLKEKEIEEETKKLEINVSKLKGGKSDICGLLDTRIWKESDTINIIRIIEYHIEFSVGIKREIEALNAEIPRIRKLIVEKERTFVTVHLETEIDRIEGELINHRTKLKELPIIKGEIDNGIERIKREIQESNRDISLISEQLDNLKRNETDLTNIVFIINYYLDCAKRNKFTSFWKKKDFKRQNTLYEEYKQAILNLKLVKRNRNELELILQEKSNERKKEQESRIKIRNELNLRKREINEKEKELARKKGVLMSIEENYLSLLENIQKEEMKLDVFKKDRELLARGDLEYDRDALKRKNSDLQELYDELQMKKEGLKTTWKKFVRGRQKLLYEQYKPMVGDLHLARRNRDELEKILQEKMEEQKKERGGITKLQSDLNARECTLSEKEKDLTSKKEELKAIGKSYSSLAEQIKRGEEEYSGLKRDINSLAHDKLKYDSEALKRENTDLYELYRKLSDKQRVKEQKTTELGKIGQKHSLLGSIIEQLKISVKVLIEEIMAVKEEIEKKKEEAKLAILNEKRIIATTNLRASDRLFENLRFDLVIMDEAGAIDLPGAVIPILKGNKIILLGDPCQLPPILSEKIQEIGQFLANNPGLKASIFEKLYKSNYKYNQAIMLKSQYRMRKEIADFVSSSFYNGLLNTPVEMNNEVRLRACQDVIISNRYPMICFQRRFWTDYNRSHSAYSIGEVDFVKRIIEKLKKEYGAGISEEIAIISPYRAQTNRIMDEIPNIECGTVHSFQGQEKSIIIYVTTKYWGGRSNDFGYLLEGETSKNLLNVAISRAKEKFIIIGCRELFNSVEIYNRLYEHIKNVGYVADRLVPGYDTESQCDVCGRFIPEGKTRYMDRYCWDCHVLHRLRTFLDDKPQRYKAKDGHVLRSSDEVRIDDWFHRNRIEHEVERRVPVGDHEMYCDWFLPRGEIYVEYWGLMHEEGYRDSRRVKEDLYKRFSLKGVSIEPEDMKDLDEILQQKFKKVLNQ